jgi:transcriptional regulator with XRE-family HTH domain
MRECTVPPPMESTDPVDVLARILREFEMSQGDFAAATRVSPVTVNRWLNRRTALTERKLDDALERAGIDGAEYGLRRGKRLRPSIDQRLDSIEQRLDHIIDLLEHAR